MNPTPVELWYQESGSGVALVLLHGFPLEHSIWLPVVDRLDKKCRVIMPDLRGQGRSPRSGNGSSIPGMAADVAALLEKLDIARAILVGHSMGGYVSLAFARRYPSRLLGLGLVASKAGLDTPQARLGRLQNARRLVKEGLAWYARSMAERLTQDCDLRSQLEQQIRLVDPLGAADALRGMANRRDATPLLSILDLPVAVIAGEEDVISPLEGARQMAQQMPNARLFGVPEAGHIPMLEQPDLVADALLWLVGQVK